MSNNDQTDPELDLFKITVRGPNIVQMEGEPDADFITRVRESLDDQAQLDRDDELDESCVEEFDRFLDSDTAAGDEGQGSN